MANHESAQPNTQNELNARLFSLSIENEARLQKAEHTCRHYEIKINAQNELIGDLVDAIHDMTGSSSGDNTLSEATCRLITQNARRVSDLSEEVEKMKLMLMLMQQIQVSNTVCKHSDDQNDTPEMKNGNDTNGFEDVQSSELSTSSVSSSSSPITEIEEAYARLEKEIIRMNLRCKYLERSLKTLKHKNMELGVRSIKSLQNKKRQIHNLEEERQRRLELQATAEERVLQLENELHELKKNSCREDIFREDVFQGQQPINDSEESVIAIKQIPRNDNAKEKETGGIKPLRGVDHCRELVMLRNKMLRRNTDFVPPLLVAVNESSEGSDHSDDSEDESIQCLVALQ